MLEAQRKSKAEKQGGLSGCQYNNHQINLTDLARFLSFKIKSFLLNSMPFYYVYILESEKKPPHYYAGFTENLESRLKAHNQGQCPHTSKHRPWKIETAIAFRSRKKAVAFEKYLKGHSGRAFAAKHF